MGKASDLFNWCKNNGWDIKRASGSSSPGTILNGFYPEHLNGTVGGIPFSQIYWHCNTNAVIGHFRFADKYGNFVTGKYEYFTRDSGENDSIPEIILDKYTPGGRTFVLKDLPTSETALKGAIYHDTQGFLKITL